MHACACSVVSGSLWPPWTVAHRPLCPWGFPGENIRAVCHFLLQGIVLTQGSNLRLLHWQADSLPVSHLGSPYAHSTLGRWVSLNKEAYHFFNLLNVWESNFNDYFLLLVREVRDLLFGKQSEPRCIFYCFSMGLEKLRLEFKAAWAEAPANVSPTMSTFSCLTPRGEEPDPCTEPRVWKEIKGPLLCWVSQASHEHR